MAVLRTSINAEASSNRLGGLSGDALSLYPVAHAIAARSTPRPSVEKATVFGKAVWLVNGTRRTAIQQKLQTGCKKFTELFQNDRQRPQSEGATRVACR